MFWLYKATLTSWHFASPFLSRDTSVVDAHVVLRICWCTGTDSGLRANDLRKIHHMPCLISGCQRQPQPPCQRQQPQMHFVGGCFKMESKHEFTTKVLRLTWVQDEHFGFPEGREVMLRQSPAKVTTIRNLQTSLRQTVFSKFPLDLPKGSDLTLPSEARQHWHHRYHWSPQQAKQRAEIFVLQMKLQKNQKDIRLMYTQNIQSKNMQSAAM